MIYKINGQVVSEATYDRDANDNFNASIKFQVIETEDTTEMIYED